MIIKRHKKIKSLHLNKKKKRMLTLIRKKACKSGLLANLNTRFIK
jgi:hypothetical protein